LHNGESTARTVRVLLGALLFLGLAVGSLLFLRFLAFLWFGWLLGRRAAASLAALLALALAARLAAGRAAGRLKICILLRVLILAAAAGHAHALVVTVAEANACRKVALGRREAGHR
jgi:hypothetical protein